MYVDYNESNEYNYDENNYNNDNEYHNNNYLNNKSKKWLFIGLIIVFVILLILIIFKFTNNKKDNNTLYITDTNIYLKPGETKKIDTNTSNNTLKWSSDNEGITVDENGVVYANVSGEAIITVTDKNGKSATCKVIVEESETKKEIQSISLDLEELELKVGEEYKFTLNINPIDVFYTNADITWIVDDSDVLEIQNNTIKALKVGKTTVTVKTSNNKEAVCNVTVIEKEKENKEVLPNKINLSLDNKIITVGDIVSLDVTFEPENVTNKTITWSSSDSSVASVDDGVIRGLKSGIVIITAKTDNQKMASCTIVVNASNNELEDNTDNKIKAIKLNKTSLTLNKGEKSKLVISISPANVSSEYLKFSWTISNENIVSVDSKGNVFANNSGSAIITVKTINGLTATCNVKVNDITTTSTTQKKGVSVAPLVNLKTFDQRNDAIVDYYSSSTKDIKSIYKKYQCKKDTCFYPKTYTTSLDGNIKIYEYEEKTGEKKYLTTVNKQYLQYIMVPNKIYYLESESNSNNNEFIKLTGSLRMIKVVGIRNMRDIGGFEADGGTLNYGKLYRSANPNSPKSETEATKLFNYLGIKVIFDLRESSSYRKSLKKMSSFEKLGSDTGYWLGSKVSGTRKSVSEIMKQIVENKGVVFHCAHGRDRTGTVAYLLEGILGVPYETRLDDFELSYLSEPDGTKTTRKADSLKHVYNRIKKYSGSNDQEKIINWFLSDSKNTESDMELINNFRTKIINGNPTKFKVQNKKCVAI